MTFTPTTSSVYPASPFSALSSADFNALVEEIVAAINAGSSSGGITIGTTTITGGTSGRILYDNAGIAGEKTVTGSGNAVLATSPTLVTPALGTPSAVVLTNATGLPVGGVSATGSPSSSNFLRGDGSWSSAVQSGVATVFTRQQNFNNGGLTDAATISWDLAQKQSTYVTLGGNRTMAAPTNIVANGTYLLEIIQDGTGSRTLTWDAVFRWPNSTAPTLSTGAGAIDVVTFKANSDGTKLLGAAQTGYPA